MTNTFFGEFLTKLLGCFFAQTFLAFLYNLILPIIQTLLLSISQNIIFRITYAMYGNLAESVSFCVRKVDFPHT